MTIPMVISNHPDLADPVRPFAVPFLHIPVTADRKPEAERRQLELLADNVDLVVLAGTCRSSAATSSTRSAVR